MFAPLKFRSKLELEQKICTFMFAELANLILNYYIAFRLRGLMLHIGDQGSDIFKLN